MTSHQRQYDVIFTSCACWESMHTYSAVSRKHNYLSQNGSGCDGYYTIKYIIPDIYFISPWALFYLKAKYKERQRSGTTVKSHIPPSKPNGKQTQKITQKLTNVRMNSSFRNMWLYNYSSKLCFYVFSFSNYKAKQEAE